MFQLIRVFGLLFLSANSENIVTFDDLEKLFDTSFGIDDDGLENQLQKFENKLTNNFGDDTNSCSFKDIIDIIQEGRDQILDNSIKMAKDLAAAVNLSLKEDDGTDVWPTCCGLNNKSWKHPVTKRWEFSPNPIANVKTTSIDEPYCKETYPELFDDLNGIGFSNQYCMCMTYARSFGIHEDEDIGALTLRVLTAARKNEQYINEFPNKGSIFQVVGLLDGTMLMFPQNDDGKSYRPCDSFDPRNRPWFKAILEEAVNYVVVIDISSSLWYHYTGGLPNNLFVKKLVRLLIGELNSVNRIVTFTKEANEIFYLKDCTRTPEEVIEELFEKLSNQKDMDNKFSNPVKNFDELRKLIDSSDKLRQIESEHIIFISDFDFILSGNSPSENMENIYFINIGRTSYHHKAVMNMKELVETYGLEDSFQFKIKRKLVKYREFDSLANLEPRYSPPYYDWGGTGEIISIGFPVFKNKRPYGVTTVDHNMLTNGMGHSPRSDSVFFYDGYKSGLIVFEIHTNKIWSHPKKTLYGDVRKADHQPLIDYFEPMKMIQCIKSEIDEEGCKAYGCEKEDGKTICSFSEHNDKKIYYWKKSNVENINIMYGVVIYKSEAKSINRTMRRLNINKCSKYTVTQKYWRPDDSKCENFKGSREPDDTFQRYFHEMQQDIYFPVTTPQAHRFQLHGNSYDSSTYKNNFETEFRACLSKDTGKFRDFCKLLLKPNAYRDLCFLYDAGWTKGDKRHDYRASNYRIKSVRLATTGGIYVGTKLPQYGYDASAQLWYRNALHSSTFTITYYFDAPNNVAMATMSKLIKYESEARLVAAIDVKMELITSIVNSIDTECEYTKNFKCYVFDKEGNILGFSDTEAAKSRSLSDERPLKIYEYETWFVRRLEKYLNKLKSPPLKIYYDKCQNLETITGQILFERTDVPFPDTLGDFFYGFIIRSVHNEFFHVKFKVNLVIPERNISKSENYCTNEYSLEICDPLGLNPRKLGHSSRCDSLPCDCKLWIAAKDVAVLNMCERESHVEECNWMAYCTWSTTENKCEPYQSDASKTILENLEKKCEQNNFLINIIVSVVSITLFTCVLTVAAFFVFKTLSGDKYRRIS